MKSNIFTSAALAASLMIPAAARADQPLTIEHLGVNNTLVRISPENEADFLMIPVQESIEDARINILVDGKLEKTINVRLPKDKTDYSVPFDLSQYKGHNVVFDIVTTQGRTSVREASQDACWKDFYLTDSVDLSNREKYRPLFHHTPLLGWMNDPNGMFYKDGVWHLYYQHNPYGSRWQNLSWGHSTSTDLINWEHQPEALEPDGLGMIFSGSSVVDTNNTAGFGKDAIVALYTSAAVSQMQSLAHSTDGGQTFEKYAGNPILTLPTEARDPNMFWHEPTQQWVLVLAHALNKEMLIFTSPDLKNWTLQGPAAVAYGEKGGVWECPDLFPLHVDGNGAEKWVLICNINPGGPFGGSATQYFIGDFDGKTFTPDKDAEGNVKTKWMDYGKDHYATVSFSDTPADRRTVLGWMSNWEYADIVPTRQFRSANTLPRDLALFTGKDGDIYLASLPSPEVDTMRGKAVKHVGKASLGSSPRNYTLPAENDGVCEIDLTLSARNGSKAVATLSNASGEKVVITYDPAAATVSFDRRQSGVTDFSSSFPAVTTAPVLTDTDKVALRLFVDRSSIELFGNDGQIVMTNLVFPTTPYTTLSVSAEGKAELSDLTIYQLNIPENK